MSSWLSDPEVAVFQQLMTVAQFRGRDGAGVVMAPTSEHKDFGILRTTVCADALVHSEDFAARRKTMDRVSCMIGHARYPTQGGLTIDDAHPVVSGHIIGVHNGTMKRVHGVAVTPTDHDTVMFYDAVAKVGIEEAIKTSDGEYCFVWVDKKDFTINFLRNDKRPLYFGHYDNQTGTVYWSSEPSMLFFVLGRRAASKQQVVIRTLPENTLYRVRLGTTRLLDSKTIKPDSTFVYTPPPSNLPIVRPTQTQPTVLDTAFAEAAKKTGTVEAADVHVQYGPDKQYLTTYPKLKHLLNNGCCVCGNPQTYNHDFKSGRVHFVNEDMLVCSGCVARDPTMFAILKQSSGRAIH
jgi:hypothetical protein